MFSKTELTQKTYQTIKIVKLIVAILANTNMIAQSRKLNIKKMLNKLLDIPVRANKL